MAQIKLYLDEDVNPLLARDLRRRGYDAVSASEGATLGLSDREQLDFARGQDRALLTHNRNDFLAIAREYAIKKISHSGILYVPQVKYGQLLHRMVHFLSSATDATVRDTFIWIR
jgi:predicted nuclease of predicted toxin-antitoxin system